jgi:hypothetical protein
MVPAPRLFDFSTPEFNERTGNVYENKQSNSREVEKLRSRETEPGSQAVGCRRFVTLRLSTLDFSTYEFREQSENVYENKGKGQNIRWSALCDLHISARFDNFHAINEDGGWGVGALSK